MRLRAFFLVSFIAFLTVSVNSWGSVDVLPPLQNSAFASVHHLSFSSASLLGSLGPAAEKDLTCEEEYLDDSNFGKEKSSSVIPKDKVEEARQLLAAERKRPIYSTQPHLLEKTPFNFLTPYIQPLINYVTSQDFTDRDCILRNLEQYKAKKEISIRNIFDIILSIQGSSHALTEEEKDIYPHLFQASIRKMVGYILSDKRHQVEAECELGLCKSFSYIPQKDACAFEILSRELEIALPLKIWQPVLGESYLDIRYILESVLTDCYPIAVPTSKHSRAAHGIKMSPLGFTIHDFIHLMIDDRHQSIFMYACTLLKEILDKRARVEAVIPLIVQRLDTQYRLMMKSLRDILGKLDEKVAQKKGSSSEQNYHKALTGFFWIMRETKGILEETFEVKTFEGFIRHITAKGIGSLHERTEWECPCDPFETSPIDGTTCLSDEEIREKVFGNLAIFQNFLTNEQKDKQLKKEVVRDCFVTKSPRFIDVRFVTITGEEFFYSVPTLLHRYRNAKHNALLFKKTGIELLFEKESTLTRQAALIEIQNVQKALVQAIESFSRMAISLASEEDEEGITLEQIFWFEFDKIIRTYKKGIASLLGGEHLREIFSKQQN